MKMMVMVCDGGVDGVCCTMVLLMVLLMVCVGAADGTMVCYGVRWCAMVCGVCAIIDVHSVLTADRGADTVCRKMKRFTTGTCVIRCVFDSKDVPLTTNQ